MADYTTVSLQPETKTKLEDFKFDARCRSFNEAVSELLERADATEDSA